MHPAMDFRRLPHMIPVFLCLAWTVMFAGSASGEEPSGRTVAVVQATSASGPGGKRVLGPEKPIYSGDRVVTDADGMAQIKFRDNTRFVVGPRSSVVIDKYVFNPNGSLAGASLNLVRGSFRFISGNGPKKSYRIRTPTGTIGIRGTALDVAVDGRLGTGVLVFSGIVELCGKAPGSRALSRCTIVRSGCDAAVASPTGRVRGTGSPEARAALIRNSFPLVELQDGLSGPYRVGTAACGLDAVR